MSSPALILERCHPNAILPARGSPDAAGLDVSAILTTPDGRPAPLKGSRFFFTGKGRPRLVLRPSGRVLVPIGWRAQARPGTYLRVAPRSGLALRHGLDVLAGVIDADFRGECMVLIVNLGQNDIEIAEGERIAQLVQERVVMDDPVEGVVDDTSRGTQGYGSTGRGGHDARRDAHRASASRPFDAPTGQESRP